MHVCLCAYFRPKSDFDRYYCENFIFTFFFFFAVKVEKNLSVFFFCVCILDED